MKQFAKIIEVEGGAQVLFYLEPYVQEDGSHYEKLHQVIRIGDDFAADNILTNLEPHIAQELFDKISDSFAEKWAASIKKDFELK